MYTAPKMTPAAKRYFLTLVGLSAAMATYGFYLGTIEQEVGVALGTMWLLIFSILVALWIVGERRAQSVAFDWPAYVFFAWPVVLPFYFAKTRGPEGLATYVGLYALCFGYRWFNLYAWWYFGE